MAGVERNSGAGTTQEIGWKRWRRGLRHLMAGDLRLPHVSANEFSLYEEAARNSGGRITELVPRTDQWGNPIEYTVYVAPVRQIGGATEFNRALRDIRRGSVFKNTQSLAGAR